MQRYFVLAYLPREHICIHRALQVALSLGSKLQDQQRGHPDREPGAGPGEALRITTCALPPVATSQEPSCRLPHCPGIQACKPGCLSKRSRSDPWTAAAKTQSQMPIKVPLGESQPPEVVGREPRQWPPYP